MNNEEGGAPRRMGDERRYDRRDNRSRQDDERPSDGYHNRPPRPRRPRPFETEESRVRECISR